MFRPGWLELSLTRCERFHIITPGFRTQLQALDPAARMTMSVDGLCSSMKFNAFLVIVFLAFSIPLASFEIPPSFSAALGAPALVSFDLSGWRVA